MDAVFADQRSGSDYVFGDVFLAGAVITPPPPPPTPPAVNGSETSYSIPKTKRSKSYAQPMRMLLDDMPVEAPVKRAAVKVDASAQSAQIAEIEQKLQALEKQGLLTKNQSKTLKSLPTGKDKESRKRDYNALIALVDEEDIEALLMSS